MATDNQRGRTRAQHFISTDVRKKATSIKASSIKTVQPRSLICDVYFVWLISCEGENASCREQFLSRAEFSFCRGREVSRIFVLFRSRLWSQLSC